MPPLTDIPGIDEPVAALLAAANVATPEDLATENVGGLYARLYQSNEDAQLVDELPPIDEIESWIEQAQNLASPDPGSDSDDANPEAEGPPPEEPDPEPPPRATSGPRETTEPPRPVENDAPEVTNTGRATLLVGLDDEAWLEAYEQASEAPILEPAPANDDTLPETGSRRKRFEKPDRPINPLAFQSSVSERPKSGPSKTTTEGPEEDQNLGGHHSGLRSKSRLPTETSARIAASSEDLPKRARRGLKVSNPAATTIGFMVALATRILVIIMLVGTPIVLIYFNQYMLYFAAIPALLVLFALLYVVFSSKVFCRVCGSNVLIPQKSHKHEKAHQLFGFGYIGSMALHGLLFGWFRCPQCGSAMRIRK
ncbi:MAG: DUF4332 domain-containing protein [Verrucomicrobiota bacterium]